MVQRCGVILAILTLSSVFSMPQTSNSIDFSEERDAELAEFEAVVQQLCEGRPANQYFRLSTESNCRDVVRCVPNDFIGGHTLAAVRCPTGLLFDLEGQVCNWAARVNNCDRLTVPRLARPLLSTPEPVCPLASQLQCGVDDDPNAAPRCDLSQCALPDCFCSADGTQVPGDLEISQVPQMITITFNGAVNTDNIGIYQDIFKEERLNPNGCQVKGTFFVSHKYTNYSAVQELHRKGHEIGVFSITTRDDPNYWTKGGYDDPNYWTK